MRARLVPEAAPVMTATECDLKGLEWLEDIVGGSKGKGKETTCSTLQ